MSNKLDCENPEIRIIKETDIGLGTNTNKKVYKSGKRNIKFRKSVCIRLKHSQNQSGGNIFKVKYVFSCIRSVNLSKYERFQDDELNARKV